MDEYDNSQCSSSQNDDSSNMEFKDEIIEIGDEKPRRPRKLRGRAPKRWYTRLMERGYAHEDAVRIALKRKTDRHTERMARIETARGLTKEGKKWFFHYISLGLSAAAARRKIDIYEQTASTELAVPTAIESSSRGPTSGQGLSTHRRVEPNQDIGSTTVATTKTTQSNNAKPSTCQKTKAATSFAPELNMVVLPGNYPKHILSADEFTQLEDAIIEEIAKGWKIKPEFSGIYFEKGMFFVKCDNQQTVDWLEKRVPLLHTWQGVKLRACTNNVIPKYYTIKIVVPKSTADIYKAILVIDAQNKGINTANWSVINMLEDDKDHVLTIVIDEQSFKLIKEKNNFLSYRFGEIKVEIKGEGIILDEDEDDVMEVNIHTEDTVCVDSEEEEQQQQLAEEQIKEEPNIEKPESNSMSTEDIICIDDDDEN